MHGSQAPTLIPTDTSQLRQLDEINSWVYDDIANGAYKAGFASAQQAYEAAYRAFFTALDRVELILSKQKYAHHALARAFKTQFENVQLLCMPSSQRWTELS